MIIGYGKMTLEMKVDGKVMRGSSFKVPIVDGDPVDQVVDVDFSKLEPTETVWPPPTVARLLEMRKKLICHHCSGTGISGITGEVCGNCEGTGERDAAWYWEARSYAEDPEDLGRSTSP